MKIFKDRQSAGKILAEHLKQYKGIEGVIVLAIPRGGVVVAHEVAEKLSLPLDIIITRKIGAPFQPELALGAVDADGEVVWDEKLLDEVGIKKEDLETGVVREVEEIRRREEHYRHARPGLARLIEGKAVILVDDGIATGATTLAAINYLKNHGAKKIILAVPVASNESVERVKGGIGEIGEIVVLETPENFAAVGQFYQNFEPVEDKEVIYLLK